jgi:hypothetical protein
MEAGVFRVQDQASPLPSTNAQEERNLSNKHKLSATWPNIRPGIPNLALPLVSVNCDLVIVIWRKSGFGKIQVDELNLESGKANVSIANSFESEPVASSTRPSCIFTLSHLEGIFSQLIAREVRGREVDCRAKGDKLCRFALSPEPSP